MNYHIVTYGCQMNVHESEKIAGILREKGYDKETSAEEADVIVFNTCCIRENAENHAFGNIGALKKLKKQKKDLIVAVGGCMAQEAGKAELLRKKFPFIDVVFGTHNLSSLGELIDRKRRSKKAAVEILGERGETEDGVAPVRTSYPNAWVNIMYGCNNFCSYCIVPYVRGRERSRRAEDVLAEVRSLVREGYREITLLGQNVNSYNSDGNGGMSFPELLEAAASVEGRFRLRFMTSHPKDFTEEAALVMKRNEKICPQLHLPAQSGSDRILSLMNRRYTRDKYLSEIAFLRRHIPDCEVTTDLIVGFPTETEEDFQETLSLVKEADFSSAFTFVYSPRTGTKAAAMDGQIEESVQKERIMRLVELVNAQTRAHSARCVGKTVEILVEDYDEKRGMYLGRDRHGRMGYFASDRNRVGEFVALRVTKANGVSLYGEPEEIRRKENGTIADDATLPGNQGEV
ncbi:MAG: tRNA (N6-isopentenyl adenosine(37)-C2)-methylthiotransferase MiaB [Candidatus Gallimonas sp.]